MTSRLAIGFVLFATLALPWGARAEEAKSFENLPQLVETALTNNPELKASEAQWEMFRNRVVQAGALEDPMLMLKLQNFLIRDPLNSGRDPMSQRVIGISQQLPFWGKRDLKTEVAKQEAEALKWQVEERKLELARMVKETYYQIFMTDKDLEIIGKNIRIMDDFIALAETKYSVGQGAQQDVFKAQTERSKMLSMKITLEQQRRTLQATLNTLLFRPAETPVGSIADFELKPLAWSPEQLRDMAGENRPLLKSVRARIEGGKAGHRLAEKEFFPDVNVSFEYMQRDPAMADPGYDMYALGFTFNLPVQRARRHAMVRDSSAGIAMAEAELNTVNNAINLGIADNLARMEQREKLAGLFKTGIIPQAEQSLESATIGYRVSKVDFLTLLDNRLTLYNLEREYYESLAEYQMRLAQLEALVGKELQE
ncbi:TolC family protein [Geobacter benzoatilyticus]|uniref:TolC family protein n=1 Tax=Geobacter benzoatilyticus TaxID=2815309 RepID=A0ABX7Q6Q5_9BACT|nr:TolC family protein [Geobacter benzoatilyticus]QSV46665.1 TolC family protein [Geobacter benzoatilyticus]